MSMHEPQKRTSHYDAASGRHCGAMSASRGNACFCISDLRLVMVQRLEKVLFMCTGNMPSRPTAAHAAKGKRRSAIQTP